MAAKASATDINFPAVAFTPDKDVWGFPDLNSFTSCGPLTLKENKEVGMEVVDSDLNRWVVRSITRLGRGEPLWKWLLASLLSTPQSRIGHELERLEPLTLAEVKARVLLSMDTFPEYYCEDDELDTVLPARKDEVRRVESVGGFFDVLGLDSFMAY